MTTRTSRFERMPRYDSDGKPKKGEGEAEGGGGGGGRGQKEVKEEKEEVVKFSPEEETSLLSQSHTQKTHANALFASAEYQSAIEAYETALTTCPNYLLYEIAVLKSNIAACHLQLGEWKLAVKAATAAVEGLERMKEEEEEEGKEGKERKDGQNGETGGQEKKEEEEEEADEEIVSAGAAKAEDTSTSAAMAAKRKRDADAERIRVKALMRRAKANSELGGWAALQSAETDYGVLSKISSLSAADRKVVQRQLTLLAPRTKVAQEKEMGEMMGKLKDLGNTILNPFGLSTDNFNMVKDEKTGGYSMNFNQGASGAAATKK